MDVSVLPQVFRAKIVSHNFLTMIGLLLVSVGKRMHFSKKQFNRYSNIVRGLVHIGI